MIDPHYSGFKNKFKLVRKLLSWILPVLIIVLILLSVELVELRRVLRITKINLLLAGLLTQILITQIVIQRWRQTIIAAADLSIPTIVLTKQFYIASAIGHLVPSSIGLDIYRVIAIGTRYGKYFKNVIAILIEKISGLITISCLIVILYPFISASFITSDRLLYQVFRVGLMVLVVFLISIPLFTLFRRQRMIGVVINYIESIANRLLHKIASHVKQNADISTHHLSFKDLIEPFNHKGSALRIISLSFAIQFTLTIKNFIFFKALGYDIPIIIVLFVVPVLYFIFFLPVSFGGVGVREGTFIVLYGLFGVPTEIALMVSFFGLLSALTIHLIGGAFLVSNRFSKSSSDRD
ncbi:lysylphosphatidylglycerol synthase transmembrane domain-containing protein [Calditrichota bacterium]